jgi:hypothetical protein
MQYRILRRHTQNTMTHHYLADEARKRTNETVYSWLSWKRVLIIPYLRDAQYPKKVIDQIFFNETQTQNAI